MFGTFVRNSLSVEADFGADFIPFFEINWGADLGAHFKADFGGDFWSQYQYAKSG